VIMRVYVVVAIALAGLLFRVDVRAAWAFLPYLLYLGYALWWTHGVWRLNPLAASRPS
jgi:tryptophan-rich sensory protein